MEGLKWPAMVVGIFAGLGTVVSGFVDLFNMPGTGFVILLLSIVVFAVCAMMAPLPGWSSLIFLALAILFAGIGSFGIVFSSPLLLIAAALGAVAAIGKRRTRPQIM